MVTTEDYPKKPADIPQELPILPSGDKIVYPSTVVPLSTGDQRIVQVIDDAMAEQKILALFSVRNVDDTPTPAGLHSIGTAVLVVRMLKWPDGSVNALLQGLSRVNLSEITQAEPYFRGKVEVLNDIVDKTSELEALTRNLLNLFQKVVELALNEKNVYYVKIR